MRKILPIVLALLGLAAGVGAGYVLRPPPEDAAPAAAESCTGADCPPPQEGAAHPPEKEAGPATEGGKEKSEGDPEYVKLNNQFIVPDMRDGKVISLTVLSIGIETVPGGTEKVFDAEPKLRDTFLQILFDHANAGGFRGDFTSAGKMEDLRRALLEGARSVLGPDARAVLISDIMRQDR